MPPASSHLLGPVSRHPLPHYPSFREKPGKLMLHASSVQLYTLICLFMAKLLLSSRPFVTRRPTRVARFNYSPADTPHCVALHTLCSDHVVFRVGVRSVLACLPRPHYSHPPLFIRPYSYPSQDLFWHIGSPASDPIPLLPSSSHLTCPTRRRVLGVCAL